MASGKEGKIQKECLEAGKKHPEVAWLDRSNSGKVRVRGGFLQLHEIGTPDLIGYTIDARVILIEIKDEDKYAKKNHSMSNEQIERLLDGKKRGAIAGCVCSVEQMYRVLNGEHVGLDDLTL